MATELNVGFVPYDWAFVFLLIAFCKGIMQTTAEKYAGQSRTFDRLRKGRMGL